MAERFVFSDLREVLAKANEQKSGDQLAGIAARSERERVAAKRKLAGITLAEIVENPLIGPTEDEVSRLILESHDRESFQPIRSMTVGEFREFILDDGTTEQQLKQLKWAIIPGNRRSGRQDHEQQRFGSRRSENQERDALPQHDGRARRAGNSRPAESSGR